jgi:hypothetical protein
MKHLSAMALMLNLGVGGAYLQQIPVNMMISGTAAPNTVNLTGTGTGEYNLAGDGRQGWFTLRLVSAGAASP